MSKDAVGTSIEIMGKSYQIKCPQHEINALQNAARYLEEKMSIIREAGTLSIDRLAVITALNVVHQLQTLEQQKNQHLNTINERLHDLQNKVEHALAKYEQLELSSAE